PEKPEVRQRELGAPVLAAIEFRPLYATRRLRRGIAAGGDAGTRLCKLRVARMEHAEHDDAPRAAVEAGVDRRGDLMPADVDRGVRKDNGAAGTQDGSEIPHAARVQQGSRALRADTRLV